MALDIQLTGRSLELTPTIKDYVNKRFLILEHHFQHIMSVHVILSVEKVNHKMEHRAEANVVLPKQKRLNADASSIDMYQSIDLLTKKLDQQLLDYAARLKDERRE